MRAIVLLSAIVVTAVTSGAMGQRVEEEDFQDAAATPPSFTNPFFNHALGRGATWSLADLDGRGDLWLNLENDSTRFTFNLGAGESVSTLSFQIRTLGGTTTPRVLVQSQTGQLDERQPGTLDETMTFSATDQIPEIGLDGNPTGNFFELGPIAEVSIIPGDGAVAIDDIAATVDEQFVCPADWDDSGAVDVFDLLAYLDDWFAGDASANLNLDLAVDVFDLLQFLDGWFAGCDD